MAAGKSYILPVLAVGEAVITFLTTTVDGRVKRVTAGFADFFN